MPFAGSVCIEYRFDRHHGPLANLSVRLLFLYRPFRRLPRQPLPISVHESPRSVKKTSDNLNGACVKALACTFLRVLKPIFINLPVSVLGPTPVLVKLI